MSKIELFIYSVIFLAIILTLKYFIAPAIVAYGGIAAALVLVGCCIVLAYWIDARDKNKGR